MSERNLPPPTPDQESDASLWAARLDGAQLTLSQRRELDAWLAADPRHPALLQSYCEVSTALEPMLNQSVAAGRIAMPEKPSRKGLFAKLAPWIAAGSLAAAAAWAFLPSRNTWEAAKMATAAGQRQSVELSDGTHVELNAGSAFLLEESSGERRTRLASGEAFFSVAKDSKHPFLVETPAGVVRVTGTAFNVNLQRDGALAVTVVEGSVQVTPGGLANGAAPVQLKIGDHLVAGREGVSVQALPTSKQDQLLAWRSGKAVFADTPLSEALALFARYHGRNLVADPAVADQRIGGRFALDDLEGFLSSLETILPVRVTRDLGGTIRVSPRPSSS